MLLVAMPFPFVVFVVFVAVVLALITSMVWEPNQSVAMLHRVQHLEIQRFPVDAKYIVAQIVRLQ